MWKKLGSRSGSLFQFEKNMLFKFFLEKCNRPAIQICNGELYDWFCEWGNSPRSSRVMQRHRIDRPNVMASEASGEAFFLMGCIKKCAVHLWPRVYSVFSETLPYRPWFYTIYIYIYIFIYIYQRFRKHFFFISSTLLACKNENLWCFSPYSVTTTYNHMTYNWPNYIPHSLIFKRMQNSRIADNIRAFSFLLTNWSKEPDEERIYRWTEFFTSWTIANKKMLTGARAT